MRCPSGLKSALHASEYLRRQEINALMTSHRQGLVFSDDLDLGLHGDASFLKGHLLDVGDEVEDVARFGAAVVGDEISVDVGDLGAAVHAALETEFIDQLAGGDDAGILEHAS